MAKAPIPAEPFLAVANSQEQFILDMLGPELAGAVVTARERLQDASIMARIGENPEGGTECSADFIPGLVSIHRDGTDTVYGLGMEDALAALAELV